MANAWERGEGPDELGALLAPPAATVREEWGLECPKCHRDDGLRIECLVVSALSVDGVAPAGDLEWSNGSLCMCNHCEHQDFVLEFRPLSPCIACGDPTPEGMPCPCLEPEEGQ